MNRQEFLNRLEYLLRDIPVSERIDALAYYNNYFDEAGVENEKQVILELGSPEAVAEKILADVQVESSQRTRMDYSAFEGQEKKQEQQASKYKSEETAKKKMSTSKKILIILLLVFTFPLWIGLVAGAFGTVVGLLAAAFGIVVAGVATAFGLLMGGVGCIIAGIARFAFSPIDALAVIGIGGILSAIGILLSLLFIWLVGVWIPKLVKALVSWLKDLFHLVKGGNRK